ncbi:MAG: lanthionine synthetase LanC family protein [Janthinobacterium lividum]
MQIQVKHLLDKVIPVLKKRQTPFKIAISSEVLSRLNEGTYGATQVGKFMTVYPRTDQECTVLAVELAQATEGMGGPNIVTDCYLGGAVYARYGIINPVLERDRLGTINRLGTNPEAAYKVPFSPPVGIDNPVKHLVRPNATGDDRLVGRTLGAGYTVVGTLATHPKGNVYKALDVRHPDKVSFVVLKEGRKSCLSELGGRDIFDRLTYQRDVHLKFGSALDMPRFVDLFTHASNQYLVLSFVEGTDVEHLPIRPFRTLDADQQRQRLGLLLVLSRLVAKMHAQGLVHRDITPRNVRVSTNFSSVTLLDYELSCAVSESSHLPFAQGTPGFMSPQQETGAAPAFSDDVYSQGALMLFVLSGLDPRRVIFAYDPVDFAARCAVLSGAPPALCALICECLHPSALQRPQQEAVVNCLQQAHEVYTTGARRGAPVAAFHSAWARPEHLAALVAGSVRWLTSPAARSAYTGLWCSPELTAEEGLQAGKVSPKFATFRSASRGVAGVIYAVSTLKKAGYSYDSLQPLVEESIDWLLRHEPSPDDQLPGLHFGEAGVAVAICAALDSGLIQGGSWVEPYLNEALAGPLDWPDLTHGAAGQGIAALLCARLMQESRYADYATPCADYLVATQEADGGWQLPAGASGMSGLAYTGFAHGVAGIVYFLAHYAEHSGRADVRQAAMRGGKWLCQQVRRAPAGGGAVGWPYTVGSNDSWHWWCHGGPGIAIALLALHRLTGDAHYLKLTRQALSVHPYEVCFNNFSQCHGLSGLGEMYLEAFRYTGARDYLKRARYLAVKLAALAKTDASGVTWLVENPHRPTADLMIGSMGVAHFLARFSEGSANQLTMPLLL